MEAFYVALKEPHVWHPVSRANLSFLQWLLEAESEEIDLFICEFSVSGLLQSAAATNDVTAVTNLLCRKPKANTSALEWMVWACVSIPSYPDCQHQRMHGVNGARCDRRTFFSGGGSTVLCGACSASVSVRKGMILDTPLITAMRNGAWDVAMLLIQSEVDHVSGYSLHDGMTPLMFAAEADRADVVQQLLEHKAINRWSLFKNARGCSAFDLALEADAIGSIRVMLNFSRTKKLRFFDASSFGYVKAVLDDPLFQIRRGLLVMMKGTTAISRLAPAEKIVYDVCLWQYQ